MVELFGIIVLIFSVIIHEYAHGWMADQLGDPTARYAGRLTLNPIPHIDPVGSVLVPLFLIVLNPGFVIGWAKPVPYNPYNLKDQKRGPAKVAFAGPAANLLLALIFAINIRLLLANGADVSSDFVQFFAVIVIYNIVLAIFNLVPLPPLDGSKILFSILPYSMRNIQETLERNYMLFLFLFILFGFELIRPIIEFVFVLLTGTY